MAKPRAISIPQLATLNRIGALQLVEPGTVEPVDYQAAWDALARAVEAGLWTPTKRTTKDEDGDKT